ncbi:thymidine kinase 2-like isoform X1, partial [Leptotrombidium deliense]
VIVEGNIGSGKTTFLKYVQKKFGDKVQIFTEPLHKWRDVKGQNLFELLYKDPYKWSLPFQMYADLSRLEIHESTECEGKIKLMERSLFSAKYCFVENVYNRKFLNDTEYVILNEFFKYFVKRGHVSADYIIYLRTTPEKCFERIQLRNRKEEKYITMDYLTSLHDLHEEWLLGNNSEIVNGFKKSKVVTLNANTPLNQLERVYEQCSFIFGGETV